MAAAEVLSVLAELEYSLRSKSSPQERITSEEEFVLRNLKGSLVDSFMIGGIVSSIVCWTGTRRFGYGPRLLYSAGAGFLGGSWACKWNLRSCLDPIIMADGTRMQRELANIMIAKQEAGQLRPSFITKHLYKLFYPEHVFVDSHPDKLYTRWRLRKSYEDDLDGGVLQNLSTGTSRPTSQATRQATESLKPSTWATTQRSQKQEVKAEISSMIHENPLYCILGPGGSDPETDSSSSSVKSRRASHSHKRARRRHRTRSHRAQDGPQSAV